LSDLTSLLQKPAGEAPKPKARPGGEYLYTVSGTKFDKSSQKKTDYLELNCIPMQAGGDVDMAEYSALTPEQQKKPTSLKFYLTPEALFMFDAFLEKVGISMSGRTYSAVIPELTGLSFWGMTSKAMVQPRDGQPAATGEPRFYNEITDYRRA
jgi:hypothetical protein